ncbi:MAG: alkaline phosphatase D family protein [Myxococcales bacterium]|nr:alkaline phosphatase D family protein [Myxococcales bacterium]
MKRRRTGFTRREWMRIAGALPASGIAFGCGDNLTPERDGGAVVLEPWAEGFLVAIWAARGSHATVVIRSEGLEIDRVHVELRDGLGSVDISGLQPDRSYEVTTLSSVGPLGPNLVRTAPADDDPRPIRFAVSGDYDPSPLYESAMLESLVGAEPELFVSLGDFPYTDNGPVAVTVGEYRQRHIDLRVSPPARALIEAVGIRAIYDDHEFHNDWDPHFVAAEPERYAAAMQVWDEMFPVRDPVGEIRYRSWRWGANAEMFLLDTRRFRSDNAAPDDARKQMLGDAQRAWLLDGVRRSTAPFKLIFTSVPLDFGQNNDSWIGFQTERALVLDALIGIPGILFLSADQHYFAAYRHAHGVREFQTGPLRRGVPELPPGGPGILFRHRGYNAGVLDVHPDRIEVTGLGADGEAFYREILTAEDLTPRV